MFAIRKIKNGRVKINGIVYAPDDPHHPYNGELDGMWYAFGVYPDPSPVDGKRFIGLWGTKEQFHSPEVLDSTFGQTPDCINGVFCWHCWTEIERNSQ